MSTEQDAHWAACLDDPGDDTARLVLADWLDETARQVEAFNRQVGQDKPGAGNQPAHRPMRARTAYRTGRSGLGTDPKRSAAIKKPRLPIGEKEITP